MLVQFAAPRDAEVDRRSPPSGEHPLEIRRVVGESGHEHRRRDAGGAAVVLLHEARQHRGVGLGLYIVRRVRDVLGGTIDAASTVGQGSTFRVWVPSRLAA